MADLPPEEQSTGEYVYDPPYLEMRLRMLLTGTNGPEDKVWAGALRSLLAFLDGTPDGRHLVADIKRSLGIPRK